MLCTPDPFFSPVLRIYIIPSPRRAASFRRQFPSRCFIYPHLSTSVPPGLATKVTHPGKPAPRPFFLTTQIFHLTEHQNLHTNSTPSIPTAQEKPSQTSSASPPDSSQRTTCSPKTHFRFPRRIQLADYPRSAVCRHLRAGSQEPVYNRAEARREGIRWEALDMCRLPGRVGGLRLGDGLGRGEDSMFSFDLGWLLGLRL